MSDKVRCGRVSRYIFYTASGAVEARFFSVASDLPRAGNPIELQLMSRLKLLAATRNKGKVTELFNLLSGTAFEIVGLADLAILTDVAETGATFRENAELKASEYAKLSGIMTLSDDSGLAVDALGGAPGVFSARYAGDDADDRARIVKLLGELNNVPAHLRTARFVCAVSVADPGGGILYTAEGVCEGSIAFSPTGSNGFGYDPIFVPNGYQQSFGELSDAIKSQISHRSAATRQIKAYLARFA